MLVKLSCSINNLLPLTNDISFLSFIITSRNEVIEKLILDNELKSVLGTSSLNNYKKHPFFYLETEIETDKEDDLSEDEIKILQDNTYLYSIILENFISFLWLVKDNCCGLDTFYTYAPSAKKIMHKKDSSAFSTCKGKENETIYFSTEEILNAIDLFVKGSSLFYHKNVRIKKAEDQEQLSIIKRDITPYDFKKVTRIERAFQFLIMARKTSQLPLKISLYMCIYETLFYGTNSGEISHQIAERVALYTVNARFLRHGIYRQIKEAYKVRSIYFHGNSFKGYKKDLSEISFYLDDLTRNILSKIILKDSAIFLQEDDLLEQSFHDLIFEDERKPSGLTIESGIRNLRFTRSQ